MMKHVLTLLAIFAGLTFVACNSNVDDIPAPDQRFQPTEAILQAFSNYFPTAENIRWQQAERNALADFQDKGVETQAVFNPAAELLLMREFITEEELPQPAIEYLNTYYSVFPITSVIREVDFTIGKGEVIYLVEYGVKDRGGLAKFDAEGNFLDCEDYEGHDCEG